MSDWNEQKIIEYVSNNIEENLNLEYKSADALSNSDGKKKELSKDISAMANSDGGVIIYGVKEFDDKQREHLPERITPISRVNFPKEWVEQIINSNIQPRIDKIKIHSIQLASGENDVAYIVEIPKSDTAHQAKDYRYYKRYNFQVLEMHDHEIRDVMNRLKFPKFSVSLYIEKKLFSYSTDSGYMPNFGPPKPKKNAVTSKMHVFAHNIGTMYAQFVNCHIVIPSPMLKKHNGQGMTPHILENTVRDVVDVGGQHPYTYNKYGPRRYKPLLPGSEFTFEDISLVEDIDKVISEAPESAKILWVIFADNAPPEMGEINLSDLEVEIIDQRDN